MGLFGGSSDVSSATSQAIGGLGNFAPENIISLGKEVFDLRKPEQLLGLAAVGLFAWWSYKKVLKK